MKPLHYIAKYIRINGNQNKFEKIIDVLNKHKISVKDEVEKALILRQFCRLASTKLKKNEKVRRMYTKFKFDDGVDLLNYSDDKKNTFMNLSLKRSGAYSVPRSDDLLDNINEFSVDRDGKKSERTLDDLKEQFSK